MAGDLSPQEPRQAPSRPHRGCLGFLTLLLLVGVLIAALFTYGPLGIASPLGTRFWELLLLILLALLVVCGCLLVGVQFFWLRSRSQEGSQNGTEPLPRDPHRRV